MKRELNERRAGLPEALDFVCVKGGVVGDDGDVLHLGLCYEQPVEWVSVVAGETGYGFEMRNFDVKESKSVDAQMVINEVPKPSPQLQTAPQVRFDCDFPDAGQAQVYLIYGIYNALRRAGAQSVVVKNEPQE